MADGKGSRWNRYLNRTKHEISFDGETLIERTVRLIRENAPSALITVTSHKPDLKTAGARRYEPKNNVLEIDRFTAELIGDDVCFLYGDVLYSEQAIKTIAESRGKEPVLFFGSRESICAVLVGDGELFRSLYLEVRRRYVEKEIGECKGWQVYHLYAGLPLGGRSIGKSYVLLDSFTRDFNSPDDYLSFISEE